MGYETVTVDSDSIQSAVNEITDRTDKVSQRVNQFMTLLEEKNNATHNKFELIKVLQQQLQQEVARIKQMTESLEDIKEALDKYIDDTAEVNDGAVFQRGN